MDDLSGVLHCNNSKIPYPLVSLVNRLPQTLQGQSPLNVHCRTFETISLSFEKDSDASDVFDSVKELTVARKRHILLLRCL